MTATGCFKRVSYSSAVNKAGHKIHFIICNGLLLSKYGMHITDQITFETLYYIGHSGNLLVFSLVALLLVED